MFLPQKRYVTSSFLITAILLISFVSSYLLMTTPTFAASGATIIDEVSDWRKDRNKRIGKKIIYPRTAVRKKIQGTARVKVTIDRQGNITDYEITKPSGEAILDKVIDKSVKLMNPLPAPPASIADSELTFIIPLAWRL